MDSERIFLCLKVMKMLTLPHYRDSSCLDGRWGCLRSRYLDVLLSKLIWKGEDQSEESIRGKRMKYKQKR